MAEARGARLEARILKQETVMTPCGRRSPGWTPLCGASSPHTCPKPVEIEDNPAIVCAALSAARMSDIAAQVALCAGSASWKYAAQAAW